MNRDQIREQARAIAERAKAAAKAAAANAKYASRGVLGDGYVEGTVNGGGTEIQFTTVNGRILIHKK